MTSSDYLLSVLLLGETLFDIDAEILGNLFGKIIGKNNTINIGYDGRLSSVSLKKKLISGLLECGVHVNEIGLCPTPLLYFSCFDLSAKGGIIVTGSHNPKNHNGFKIVLEISPPIIDRRLVLVVVAVALLLDNMLLTTVGRNSHHF